MNEAALFMQKLFAGEAFCLPQDGESVSYGLKSFVFCMGILLETTSFFVIFAYGYEHELTKKLQKNYKSGWQPLIFFRNDSMIGKMEIMAFHKMEDPICKYTRKLYAFCWR